MDILISIVWSVIMVVALFFLGVFFFVKIEPKEGRDYTKIIHPEGIVHYMVGGIISPMKPEKYTLFKRYILGE